MPDSKGRCGINLFFQGIGTVTRSGKSFNVPLANMRNGTNIIEISDDEISGSV